MIRYEWRDTGHGPQLWSLERECWALWYGIGAIGIADDTKAEIEAALNPCWGAADEALCAAREQRDAAEAEAERLRATRAALLVERDAALVRVSELEAALENALAYSDYRGPMGAC